MAAARSHGFDGDIPEMRPSAPPFFAIDDLVRMHQCRGSYLLPEALTDGMLVHVVAPLDFSY
jgi:hypothetical protein